jgi:hypothetical protein
MGRMEAFVFCYPRKLRSSLEAVSKPLREGDRHNLLRRLRKLSQSPGGF